MAQGGHTVHLFIPCLLFFFFLQAGFSQSGIITTYAGSSLPVTDAPAVTQAIDAPYSVTPDGSGGTYVAIPSQHRILRVTTDGRLIVVAGNGTLGFTGDGGAATSAQFDYPSDVAVDGDGNLYIADTLNVRIRKVSTAGIITTFAGTGTAGFTGDGGPATSAQIDYPNGVAVDGANNIYITGYSRVRKVNAAGIITTVAGNGTSGYSGDGGAATSAQVFDAAGVSVDGAGNLYIADVNNRRIRRVNAQGIIDTVAGNGAYGFGGDGGAATSAEIAYPVDVAVDDTGNVYIADADNSRIRKVNAAGIISTVAGNGTVGFSGDGGSATLAELNHPAGVAIDGTGNLYVADSNNRRIRWVNAAGTITTVAGNGVSALGDGESATLAQLNGPLGVAVDGGSSLYVADVYNHRIRKVDAAGIISTVVGNGTPGFSGDGGPATSAQISHPYGVAVDGAGNLYIADSGNQRIRKVSTSGIISTVAGNGSGGYSGDGGAATSAQLGDPLGVAVDEAGNLYIADSSNRRIRKVSAAGVITTVAGNGSFFYSGDGGAATSGGLGFPLGVAVDTAGNFYIPANARIRKVSAGIISTVAGNGTGGFSGDGGAATSARISGNVRGVAVDRAGNLYFADSDNNRVRQVSAGIISTIAGSGVRGFAGDGGAATSAQLAQPNGVTTASGNLFVVDTDNNRIRKVGAVRKARSQLTSQ